MRDFLKSFQCALRGIADSVKTGRNLRVQMTVALYALVISAVVLQTAAEWAILLLAIGLVLSGEIFNTSIEQICNEITKDTCESIRFIKDAAAGAVFLLAVMAAAIGALLFLRENGLYRLLTFCRIHPWYPALLVFLAVPAFFFITKFQRK